MAIREPGASASSALEERLDVRAEERKQQQDAEADEQSRVLQERGECRELEHVARAPHPPPRLPLRPRRSGRRRRVVRSLAVLALTLTRSRMQTRIGLVAVGGGGLTLGVALSTQFGQKCAQRDVQELRAERRPCVFTGPEVQITQIGEQPESGR